MQDWIYDLETYPNIFTAAFVGAETNEKRVYEISDRVNQGVQLHEFLTWLFCSGSRLVGFNNIGFDYPIIHDFILNPHYTHVELYAKAMSIINNNDRFPKTVWESEHFIKQIDLFKIYHFDNQAKRTSLKQLQFAMCSESVEDLPFGVGIDLDDAQKDELIKYNFHDIDETLKFYKHSGSQIKLREELSKKYNKNFLNHNDTKIGKDYFIMELEKNGVQCYIRGAGGRQPRQTFRPEINLGECVLPYIEYNHPAFKAVKDWLMNKTITKTKGVFELIEVEREMARHMNSNLVRVHGLSADQVKQINPKAKADRRGVVLKNLPGILDSDLDFKLVSGEKDSSGLNCIVDGFEYVFGTGGIHGSVPSQTIESDDLSHISADDLEKFKIINFIDCNFNSSEVLSSVKDELKDFAMEYLKFTKGGLQ